jgi:carbon storage regulator
MLVIRRRTGESFFIGEDIEVQVLEASSTQVKLGIRAPKSIGVVRSEIRTVGKQNQASAQSIGSPRLEKLLKKLTPPTSPPIRPV